MGLYIIFGLSVLFGVHASFDELEKRICYRGIGDEITITSLHYYHS
jgi:hypothetical protein